MKEPSALKAVLPLVVLRAADCSVVERRRGWVVGEGREILCAVRGEVREGEEMADFLTGVEVW